MTEDRRNVHDHRLAPRAQERERRANHLDRGKEVHFHQLPQTLCVGALEIADRADAGIIDEQIEAAEPLARAPEERGTRAGLDDIAGDKFELARQMRRCDGECGQPIFAPRRRDYKRILSE